jgi:hypothetical protein
MLSSPSSPSSPSLPGAPAASHRVQSWYRVFPPAPACAIAAADKSIQRPLSAGRDFLANGRFESAVMGVTGSGMVRHGNLRTLGKVTSAPPTKRCSITDVVYFVVARFTCCGCLRASF